MSVNKVPGVASRSRKSSNGVHGAGIAAVQKDHSSAKNSARNSPSDNVSPTRMSQEKPSDQPLTDQGHNQRLILRLPNTGRSPSRGASGGTFEEPSFTCGKTSPPADIKKDNQDRRVKAKIDCLQTHVSNVINDASNTNDTTACDEAKGSPSVGERCRANDDGDKAAEIPKTTCSSTGFVSRSGKVEIRERRTLMVISLCIQHLHSDEPNNSALLHPSIPATRPRLPATRLYLKTQHTSFNCLTTSVTNVLTTSSSLGSTKSGSALVCSNSKDQNVKLFVCATSDLPLTPIKEERSSSSSQSQNNSRSCSTEHAKAIGSCREDAKSSFAVSMSVNKVPGAASRSRKSSNGVHGAGIAAVQKDHSSAKNSARNSPSDKVSPTRMSQEKPSDQPLTDQGHNQRLILRLPNTGRSPSRGASGGTFEEPSFTCGKTSPPADIKKDNQDRRVKAKIDCLQTHVSNVINDASNTNDTTACDEAKGSPSVGERCRANDDGDKAAEIPKTTCSSTGFVSRSELLR
ncbi:hypothetical protein RYX36_018343 [Vicia faba]